MNIAFLKSENCASWLTFLLMKELNNNIGLETILFKRSGIEDQNNGKEFCKPNSRTVGESCKLNALVKISRAI